MIYEYNNNWLEWRGKKIWAESSSCQYEILMVAMGTQFHQSQLSLWGQKLQFSKAVLSTVPITVCNVSLQICLVLGVGRHQVFSLLPLRWLIGWLAGWLAGRLAGWLTDWLAGWRTHHQERRGNTWADSWMTVYSVPGVKLCRGAGLTIDSSYMWNNKVWVIYSLQHHVSRSASLSQYIQSPYCIMPYMAFCEWVLLGNWSAVKRGNLYWGWLRIKTIVCLFFKHWR